MEYIFLPLANFICDIYRQNLDCHSVGTFQLRFLILVVLKRNKIAEPANNIKSSKTYLFIFYTCEFLSLLYKITVHVNNLTYQFLLFHQRYLLYICIPFYLHRFVYFIICISHSHVIPLYCSNTTFDDGNVYYDSYSFANT